ncbi:RNA-binding domain-containing protein [Methylomarinum vadi]|uniref:RNA-binding domain-containing protein n=1 Tax=Methylomarinum vadi TaxID=438855 RepID=UPI0004DFAE33|nr:RNA-binding domain-containing protein [Methylomarinum vadi]
MNEMELLNLLDLGEDQEVEFKSAEGGLPRSIWETVSSFANTEGGYLILGVKEKGGQYHITGITNPELQRKAFWDGHNDANKLSRPLCRENDVQILTVQEKTLLLIHIPQASRTQRPIYINGNPLTGTYKRNFEGDYHCPEAEIRQMLRDAGDEPQDGNILENFTLDDLDTETFKAYRNRFASREPDHPFLALDDQNLLEKLGGWRSDRKSGRFGLTTAGLLMFGKEKSILEAFPRYLVDYQEHLSDDPEVRWTFRLSLDGRWESNIFNFYARVYRRLTDDLEVPFKLDKLGIRQGETHVHEALREALINCLVHADHHSSRPIKIIKRRDRIEFLNPGRLRISLIQLYEGGISDPRNPTILKMFQLLGLGEKSGSGMPKILRAWREQSWLKPLVSENLDLDMTQMTLPLISLIPDEIDREIKNIVGSTYNHLSEFDRFILVLAHRFDSISNADIKLHREEHPREIGERLKYLVQQGLLKSSGHGRGTRYSLQGKIEPDLFSNPNISSEHNKLSSEHNKLSSEHNKLSSEHYADLLKIAEPVRSKKRVSPAQVKAIILKLCGDDFLPLRTLAKLLDRAPDTLRIHYINPMLKDGLLELKYPIKHTHSQQAYRTKKDIP